MNPFIQEEPGEFGEHDEHGEYTERWNLLRRQLYYAVQLFIIRYQEVLIPGTKIFKLLQSIADERYIDLEPQVFQYQQFIEIVTKYITNLPRIIQDLERHGRMRIFDFTNLARQLEKILPECENIFE